MTGIAIRQTTLAALPLVAAGTFLAHSLSAIAFRKRKAALVARLGRAAAGGMPVPPIPAIVRSFARRAAPGEAWRPLTAEQVISVHEPGFVWLACVQLAPALRACILDAYVGGEGLLEVRLFGSVRLARAAGPQVSRGELMRYLAELAWAPHAMLHNPHLRWREVDTTTVEVSADSADGPARVRLVFEDGDIARIEADDRPRAVGRRTIPTRWAGRFLDYREVGGCRIPTRAEVSWILDSGSFACWRGEVTAYESRVFRTCSSAACACHHPMTANRWTA